MAEDKPSGSGLSRGMLPRKGGAVSRLPSIRTPRDLTLGGVRKKQFTPTIPIRKKKTETDSTTVKDNAPQVVEKKSHERKDSSRGGRGRGRGRPEVVQSHSIFEQGPCERVNKGRGSVSVERGESSSASVPRAAIKREIKKDDPDTKRVLDDLLRDDFIDDKDIDPEPNLIPVKLPMVDRLKIKQETDVKPSIKIKEEPPDEFDEIDKIKKKRKEISMEIDDQHEEMEGPPETCAQLFNMPTKSEAELILMQFPDTLPGHPPLTDEDLGVKRKEPSTSKDKTETDDVTEKLDQCTLRSFPEGYVGKLQIHKSGKVKLVFGNVKLDVSLGMPAGFLQDLVSIRVDPETEEGEMITLGHVQHKLVCTPDFDSLMSQR